MPSKFTLYDRGESRIVIPLNQNAADHDTIVKLDGLMKNRDTGGYCKTYIYGGWREDDHETPCIAYDVAGLSFDTLRQCAEIVLASGETDVYVRLPDGESGWFNAAAEDTLSGAPSYMSAAPAVGYTFAADGIHGANLTHPAMRPDSDYPGYAAEIAETSRLHGTRATGWRHSERTLRNIKRDVHLLAWAAKALVHERATGMVLGALPHTMNELVEAIAAVEAVYGKPAPSTDEGVRAYNHKR